MHQLATALIESLPSNVTHIVPEPGAIERQKFTLAKSTEAHVRTVKFWVSLDGAPFSLEIRREDPPT